MECGEDFTGKHCLGVFSVGCGQVLATECRKWPRNGERQGWVFYGVEKCGIGVGRGCVGVRGFI